MSTLLDDIKIQILGNHYLLKPTDKLSVVHDLCGIQAQYESYAKHSIMIRCNGDLSEHHWGEGLVKNWTIRGTLHIFTQNDISTQLYENSESAYSKCIWNDVTVVPIDRSLMFADFIVKKVKEGVGKREDLKKACIEIGMTDKEGECLFNAWGGIIRNLCEKGLLCYKVGLEKELMACEVFDPLQENEAKKEMYRRYFSNYAPATIKDASYFFSVSQAEVKKYLNLLDYKTCEYNNESYYYIQNKNNIIKDIPICIFLSGFDPLLLGYQKHNNLFLPDEYIRGIFNLQGIVFPAILLDGTIIGRWKKINTRIVLTLFRNLNASEKAAISNKIECLWKGTIKKITWQ